MAKTKPRLNKTTIIHLNCHSIPDKEIYIMKSWPSRTAQYIQKYSDEYRHECWYPINNIKKPRVIKKDNITYRLFPTRSLSIPLESFFGLIFSPSLIHRLKQASVTNSLLHLQGERGLLVWQAINIFKSRPIVLQFHGYRGTFFLRPIEKLIIETGEKHFFPFVGAFFVHSKIRVDYLKKICHIPSSKIFFQNMGVDYNLFQPANKIKTKKKLGLPIDKNIILYVGLFNKTKGVEKIIKAHLAIKRQHHTYLVMIGGATTNPLYQSCQKNADLVLERIPHQELIAYYQAADAYCMICPPEKSKFAGLGIASVEALACNTPILNSDLDDTPSSIRKLIGYKVSSAKDLSRKLPLVFNHKDKYARLHQITKPYFSWETIAKNIIKAYRIALKSARSKPSRPA